LSSLQTETPTSIRHKRQRKLFELAQEQGGYFRQASANLGYTANERNYHVKPGNWVREHRGIFHLALYPSPDRPDLVPWWLWPHGRSDAAIGVFNHATAPSLHDVTDASSTKIDLTVPAAFRKGTYDCRCAGDQRPSNDTRHAEVWCAALGATAAGF